MRQLTLGLTKETAKPSDFRIVSHNNFEKIGFTVIDQRTESEVMHFDNTEDCMKCIALECGYRNFDYDGCESGKGYNFHYSSSSIAITPEIEMLVIDKSLRFVEFTTGY